jgi:CRP-like cAMP-binding protein
MERMAAADPSSARRFAQIAMLNFDLTLRVIDALLIPQADRRVAAVLTRLAGERDHGAVHLSQAELGLVANASRKVVNCALGRFAERGWVIRGYSAIEVVDARSLRAFADGRLSPT